MDAGIPQAEALGTDECACVSDIRAFCRACTRAFRDRVADTTEIRPPNPRPRLPCSQQKPREPSLRPPWTSREHFPSGLSPPKCARIAITPDTVRAAHGAAIVEVLRDESGG